jgi:putative nucleotidyltransferase with HDIG domain
MINVSNALRRQKLEIENRRHRENLETLVVERTDKLKKTMNDLQKAIDGIIEAMGLTVEIRDPYTAGHQTRVTEIAHAIAIEMGIPKQQIEGVRMAGVIHDIGKMVVPAEILSKPGKITEHEFGIIKSHPEVGYNILKKIDFPWPIAQIVYQHHERLDGSGYPQGLSGKDILLEARIMAVADVVEAMASHRPYRPALGIDIALEEIEKNKGGVYDSEVVDACLRIFKEEKFKLSD